MNTELSRAEHVGRWISEPQRKTEDITCTFDEQNPKINLGCQSVKLIYAKKDISTDMKDFSLMIEANQENLEVPIDVS